MAIFDVKFIKRSGLKKTTLLFCYLSNEIICSFHPDSGHINLNENIFERQFEGKCFNLNDQ